MPHFPLRRWWATDGLCDIERVYFAAIKDATSLLDVGAGDLRVRDKFLAEGYAGTYHTQDIGREFEYTYRSLYEVQEKYDAVLCFDVLEHLPLEDGLSLLDRLVAPPTPRVVNHPNAERPMCPAPAWMGYDTPAHVQPPGPLGVCADFGSGRDRIPGLVHLPTDLSDRVASVCREPVRRHPAVGVRLRGQHRIGPRGGHLVGRSRMERSGDRWGDPGCGRSEPVGGLAPLPGRRAGAGRRWGCGKPGPGREESTTAPHRVAAAPVCSTFPGCSVTTG